MSGLGDQKSTIVWLALFVGLAMASLGWPGSSRAQQASTAKTYGCAPLPRLPVVPLKEPRPPESSEAGQQWDVTRAGEDPVAAFIDTLQGNDAALEVHVGQSRLLTTKVDLATQEGTGFIGVSDPSVVDFQILPNPRMIRITGRRAGVTDLSVTTPAGETVSFEVHVVYDLELLRAQLKELFPDALLKLAQIREHVVVEGQARNPAQVGQIIQMIESYLESIQGVDSGGGGRGVQGGGQQGSGPQRSAPETARAGSAPEPKSQRVEATDTENGTAESRQPAREALSESGGGVGGGGAAVRGRIINLIRVPGVRQVMLQVRIAELNRTGLREIGADVLGVDPSTGNIFGTSIAGATVEALSTLTLGGLTAATNTQNGPNGTAIGIFPSGDWEILLRALRQNSLVRVLAEPNLVALSGHEATFLAGGQFPVPVAQGGFGTGTVSVQWKDFGVQLNFTPYVIDGETIRLVVAPEVSTIDDSLGTTLVVGGQPIPGVNTRRTTTTVELRQGQTLAIGGVLQVTLDAQTSRIPGLGDLPYIGPLFSNTSHERVEKELLVVVTPYLIRPMEQEQVPPLPGDELQDPNDLEFYLHNRIEGRTGRVHRSTLQVDRPFQVIQQIEFEREHIRGPVGFSP